MNKAKMLCLLLVMVFVPTIFAGEISPYLADYLNGLATSDNVSVMVMLSDQADIATLNEQLKAEHATLAERNRRVIEALQEVASNTQPVVSAYFDELVAAGNISNYRMMWIANMALVEASKAGVYAIANNSAVGTIYYNYEIASIKPVSTNLNDDPPLIASHETGADLINAPAAWAAGFTGLGRVVANMDTGVDGDHEAFTDRFRGDVDGDGDVDESWYDPYAGWTYPQDSAEHGTHTMGTICGRSADGDTIGIAIDAQWIAAAPIDRGGGIEGTMEDAVLSFEWFADPDADPTTQDNPDAVGNSWGISPIYHGVDECDETFWVVIDNLEAAGTAVVFSAGNEGTEGEQSLRTPANRATTDYNCFSVGSVGDNLDISYFSSLGPSICTPDGSETIKPEVVAHGEDVRSSLPGNSYGTMSGTSMASPHITGSIGVIRSANPDLDVDSIKEILMATAVDLGDDGEDNTYGHGIIDLYEACLVAQSGYGYAEGYVYDPNNNVIADAKIAVEGTTRLTYADDSGFYHIGLPASETPYTLIASYFGYVSSSADVTIEADQTVTQDFHLVLAEMGTLYGYVRDLDSNPIEGAAINIADTPLDPVYTNSEGYYIMDYIPGGATYTVEASASSFGFGSAEVFVPVDGSVQQDFTLQALESFEANDAGWEGNNGWEWGEPTSGPGEAFDGNKVWGNSLTGSYEDNADDTLLSNYYTITEATASLTFYHWYEFENSYDGGNVSISADGGATWTLLTPDEGYPDNEITGLEYEPGYTGASDEYVLATFDISGYENETVKFRFRLGTDVSVYYSGWYIDGVVVNGGTAWEVLDPNISVTPSSLHANLGENETEDYSLTISNSGEGILEYTTTVYLNDAALNTSENNNSPAVDISQYIEKYKENGISHYIYTGPKDLFSNISSGNGAITAIGGPDDFGYTWIDSDETNGPTYNWIDITGNGVLLEGLNDDENVGPFDIGFTFPFYGEDFTTFRVCSNGWISFTSTSNSLGNAELPTGSEPFNLIAPFWDDLNPGDSYGSGDVYYYSNNTDTLIVSYIGVPHYNYDETNTFQAILTADGNIVFQYSEVSDPLDSYTTGIQNGDATIGLQVAYQDDSYLQAELAIKIKYPLFWLTVSPSGGMIQPGGSTSLTATFNSAGLGNGDYTGFIYIESNDPDSPTITVPCTLSVTGVVGIEDDDAATLPTTFALAQNYPNPFNPTTEISFGLPTTELVNLAVYDVMGRKVATLANEEMTAGKHTIIWNGTNNSGDKVTSGVYFYKLTAGENTITKKMIMLK